MEIPRISPTVIPAIIPGGIPIGVFQEVIIRKSSGEVAAKNLTDLLKKNSYKNPPEEFQQKFLKESQLPPLPQLVK